MAQSRKSLQCMRGAMPKDRALLDWMRVDRKDEASLQEQVRCQLLAGIGDGRLISGDLLPSSRVLARQLGVSRGTVLAAFEQLLGDGLLETTSGSATAVSKAVLANKDKSELTVPVGAQTPFARIVHRDLGHPVPAPQPEFLQGCQWNFAVDGHRILKAALKVYGTQVPSLSPRLERHARRNDATPPLCLSTLSAPRGRCSHLIAVAFVTYLNSAAV